MATRTVYHREWGTHELHENVFASDLWRQMQEMGWSLTPWGYEEGGSPPVNGVVVKPDYINGGDNVIDDIEINGGWLPPGIIGPSFLPVIGGLLVRWGRTIVQFFRTPSASRLITARGAVVAGGAATGLVAISNIGDDAELAVPAGIAPLIAYHWSTGTAIFFRLKDGRIAVQNKMGVWRVYRPAKHIVIPRDPKIATLLRAHKKVNKLVNRLSKQATKRRN